jgi:hypothetical protein
MARTKDTTVEEKAPEQLFPHTVIISGNDYVVMASSPDDLARKVTSIRERLSSPSNQ